MTISAAQLVGEPGGARVQPMTLVVELTDEVAARLRSNTARAIDLDPFRFDHQLLAPDASVTEAPGWHSGTVAWTDTLLEALVLCAFEKARGHTATLLYDTADWGDGDGGYCVLSTRGPSA